MSFRISNPEGLWIKKIPMKRIENEHGWAELRIKHDEKTNSDYLDVIVARKYHDPHIHVGRKLDGEILFSRSRGELQSSHDLVESKLHGKIFDEALIFKSTTPKMPVDVVTEYNGTTKEVTVKDFRFRNSLPF